MDERKAAVRALIGGMISEQVIYGASYAFISMDDLQLYYEGMQGCAAPYDSRPVLPGMHYDLASLTKVTGTTVRILQLAEEGRLPLSTPVQEILEKFPHPGIPVENLLLHDSGLMAEIPDKELLTAETIIDCLYKTPVLHEPGQEFLYSDAGYILLGLIINKLDGTSLEESFQNHIFKPLHMEHTTYLTTGSKELYLPTECTPKRGCIQAQVHDSKAYLLGQSGSAGLFSTLSDLSVFAYHYLTESPKLFRSHETYQIIRQTTSKGRTYGFSKEYGENRLYHTGFTGTSLLMDLTKREAMILLTNRIHPSRNNASFLEKRSGINQTYLKN